MNEIDSISIIKREELDECNYFKTLLEEGYDKHLIKEEDIIDIQMQLLQLLDERVYRYNGIDSSSIKTEIMEEISNSNIYTIGIYLKTFRNPDKALDAIKEKGIQFSYQEGKRQIDKMLNVIRVMYIKVKQNSINVQNYIYDATIMGGIQGFLKIYDPDFKAQDMKITADYPTYNNLIGKLEGVEFIKEYLNSIYLENIFCSKFSIDKIKYLLLSYANDYKDLIVNIFEIIFLEAIGCKLAKRDIQDLAISSSELSKIYATFENQEKNEIGKIIKEIYKEIKSEILYDNKQLSEYIEKNLNYVINVIINGVKTNSLDKIFIVQKFINNY
ncbi:MAG: DUF6179 domain-containing protein [Clostridia bacterium]|nr:DUF6179 domain-containing protein [Clostridia bacterium]